jgi:hypothetical protein
VTGAPFLEPVDSRRGAPFGRPAVGDRLSHDLNTALVPLDEGYDPGGAYWGERPAGVALACMWSDDGSWVRYYDKPI